MADIFISYKREELEHARRVAAALEAEGFSIFYDLGDAGIHAGEAWDRRLEHELATARCCVVLWSPQSIGSDNVRSEARRAKARDILVPALIARCDPPIGLDSLQAANLIGWDGELSNKQWRYLVDRGITRTFARRNGHNLSAAQSARMLTAGAAIRDAPTVHVSAAGAALAGWTNRNRLFLAALVSLVVAYSFFGRVINNLVAAAQYEIARRDLQFEQAPEPVLRDDVTLEVPASLGDEPTAGANDVGPPAVDPARPLELPAYVGAAPVSRDVTTPAENRPRTRRVFDALSIESLAHPDQSSLVFPTAFFNRRLQQELGGISTPIQQIRLGVVFVEPRASRAQAVRGTVIGYFLVSFPSLPECSRRFGGPSYAFPDADTGMMGAVNDAAPDVAHWIERASREEVLICPD